MSCHIPLFCLQSLESRCLMSANAHMAAPVMASAASSAVASIARPLKLAAVPSLADRQEILKNWYGAGGKQLSRLLAAGDTAGFDQTLLYYMVNRTTAHYFFSPSDIPGDVQFDWNNIPQQVNTTIALADKTMAGLFPDQGNSSDYTVQLPHDFSWLTQPATTTNPEFLHSLQRMSFWPGLAMAYRFTGNQSYADELIRQMTNWTRQDPPLSKPDDWINTSPRWWLLDAAMRTDNWLWSYNMLLGTAALTPAANTMFVHDMLLHGDFLSRATPGPLTSNQTLTHAQALMEIGMMFPEFKYGKTYRQQGMNLLFQAEDAQLYADGGQAEESPGYQAGVVESLLQPYVLSQLNGVAWPQAEVDRLHNAANSYYQLLEPDATQAALSDTYRTSGITTVGRAALALNESDWAMTRTRVRDVFLFGQAVASQALGASSAPTLTGRGNDFAMPTSGYWITRSDESRDARQLIVDAGPTGGTHGHFDLLNFDLYGFGKPLIADAGPYQYDSSKNRAYVISTAAHNTINVDGVSHAREDGAGNSNIALDGWTTAVDHVVWTAHHFAYTALAGAPVVGRTIWSNRDDVTLVVDFASASSTHTFNSGFNLAGANVSVMTNGAIHTTSDSGNVLVQTLILPGITTAARRTFISSNPPPNQTSPARRFTASQTGSSALIANLVVAYAGATPPAISAVWETVPKRGRAGVIRLTRDGVDQLISIPVPAMSAKAGRTRSARATANAPIPPAAPSVPHGVFAAGPARL